MGPGGRHYLIFHAKEQANTANWRYPHGYSGRTVYFKELTFHANGNIQVIENGDTGDQRDTEGFLVPWNWP